MEAVRCREAGPPRLRQISQRGHQRDAGAHGRRGRPHRRPDPEALRRQGAPDGGVRAMRRLAGREPPSLLLRRLLLRFHQTRGVHTSAVSRNGNYHLLHRHPHSGQAGRVLRARAARRRHSPDQRQGRPGGRESRHGRPAGDRRRRARRPEEHAAFRVGGAGHGHRPADGRASGGAPARRIRVSRTRTTGPEGSTRRAASAGRAKFPRPCRMPPARP